MKLPSFPILPYLSSLADKQMPVIYILKTETSDFSCNSDQNHELI